MAAQPGPFVVNNLERKGINNILCPEPLICNLLFLSRFIIVVEHDLSVLDYLSDFICCLYGVPGAYGVVTMPFSVREGKMLSMKKLSFNSAFV